MITLTEMYKADSSYDSDPETIEVDLTKEAIKVSILRSADKTDSPARIILWSELDNMDAIADMFMYETISMFKTLVPMLIKARTLQSIV